MENSLKVGPAIATEEQKLDKINGTNELLGEAAADSTPEVEIQQELIPQHAHSIDGIKEEETGGSHRLVMNLRSKAELVALQKVLQCLLTAVRSTSIFLD